MEYFPIRKNYWTAIENSWMHPPLKIPGSAPVSMSATFKSNIGFILFLQYIVGCQGMFVQITWTVSN